MFHNWHGGPRGDFCGHTCFPTQVGSVLHESQWAADFLGNHCSVMQNEKKKELKQVGCWVLPCLCLRAVCRCEAPKVKISANAMASVFFPLIFYFHRYWIGWVQPVDTCILPLFYRMPPSIFVGMRTSASYGNQVRLSPWDSLPLLASLVCRGMSEEALAGGVLAA